MPNWKPLVEEIVTAGKPLAEDALVAATKLSQEALGPRTAATIQSAGRTIGTLVGHSGGQVGEAATKTGGPRFTGTTRTQGGPVDLGTATGTTTRQGGPVEFRDKFLQTADRPANSLTRELQPDAEIKAVDGIALLTEKGFLPPGVFRTNYHDFALRFGVNDHRQAQLQRLQPMLESLNANGVDRLYVAGSFVTSKTAPKDIDILVHTGSPINTRTSFLLDKLRGIEFGETKTYAKRTYGVDLMVGKASEGTKCEHFKLFTSNRQDEPIGIIQLILSGK